MRVTHLGKFYPPVPGGMERVLQALCEGERSLGADSRALVVGRSRETVVEEVNGVPVTRAGSILRVGSVWLSPALIALLKRDAGDLVVLHEPNPMALLAYAIARPRQPLVVWYHSEVIRPRWRYRAFYHPFLSFALGRASRIVASSPALVEHAAALAPYRDRTVVVPFGLPEPPPSAPSSASVDAVRARWRGPVDSFCRAPGAVQGRRRPPERVDRTECSRRDRWGRAASQPARTANSRSRAVGTRVLPRIASGRRSRGLVRRLRRARAAFDDARRGLRTRAARSHGAIASPSSAPASRPACRGSTRTASPG